MTIFTLAPYLTQRFTDNNGNNLANGQLFTYIAGTSTPQATYTDSTGATPNPNPIILNARGEAAVWIPVNTAYKFVLEDAAGNVIWTRDQVQNQLTPTSSFYGGVDTGAANAYVVTGVSGITSYADGIVIYFFPGHTNTGASTLNVNGIGVVSVTNANGQALLAGQIQANQMTAAISKGGAFVLLPPGSTVPFVLPSVTINGSNSTIIDAGGFNQAIGFLGTPPNTQNSNYSTQPVDSGRFVYHSDANAYTWTILDTGGTLYPIGTVIGFVNDASAAVNITLAISGATLLWTPSGSTGSRTIAQFGRAIAQKVANGRWYVNGTGLT